MKVPNAKISISYLASILIFEDATGTLTWKPRGLGNQKFLTPQSVHAIHAWNSLNAGTTAGTVTKSGAIRLKVLGGLRMGHDVCWAMHYGKWPTRRIIHLNRDKADNRIANLSMPSLRGYIDFALNEGSGGAGGNRTHTSSPKLDFESSASTNSATAP